MTRLIQFCVAIALLGATSEALQMAPAGRIRLGVL